MSVAATGLIFRRVLRNTAKLLGGRAVNAVLSLACMALAARALGVEGFGLLVLIHAFAQLVSDVAKFQSWQTVLQYGAEPLAQGRTSDLQRVVRFTAALDAASGLAGAVLAAIIALAVGERLGWQPAQAPVAAAYMVSVLFLAPAAPRGLLRLFDRFDILAGQAVAASMVRLLGCGLGYAIGAPLEFFLLVWAAGSLAGFVLVTVGAWRELRRRGLLQDFAWRAPWTIGVPGAWRFAWLTNLNATLGVAFTHVVTLMVGALLGPAEAGLWRVGRQIADAIAKPAKLLSPALYPELARLRTARGEATMWRLASRIALTAGAVGAVLFALSAFAGAPLLRLIMGAGFEAAAGVMTWQVAAAVIGLLALPLEPMVISLGRAGAAVRVRMVVTVGFAVLLPPAVQSYGLHGAGAMLVLASAALGLGMLTPLLRGGRGPATNEPA